MQKKKLRYGIRIPNARGDIRKKPLHQGITAAADGANAATSAAAYFMQP